MWGGLVWGCGRWGCKGAGVRGSGVRTGVGGEDARAEVWGSSVRVWKVEGARVRYTSSSLTLLDMTAKKVHGYHSVDHFTGLFHALFRCPACLQALGVKGHLHKLHSKAGFWHPVSICVFYKTSVSTYMYLCLTVSMAVTPSFVHCLGALNGIMKA